MNTKVELITDNNEPEIATTFYAEKLKGKKSEWGVYAEHFYSDSPALIAIVSEPYAQREARKIATVLEMTLQGQKKRN